MTIMTYNVHTNVECSWFETNPHTHFLMPNVILTLMSVHCMYTACLCMFILVVCWTVIIIQTQDRIFLFIPGGGWQSGALYMHMHCTQTVSDNVPVYPIYSKCKGSQIQEPLFPYKVISVEIFKQRSTWLCKQ